MIQRKAKEAKPGLSWFKLCSVMEFQRPEHCCSEHWWKAFPTPMSILWEILPHFRPLEPSKTHDIMSSYFFLSLRQEIKFANDLLHSSTRIFILFPEDKLFFMLHKKQCMLFFLFLWEVALCLEIMLPYCFKVSIRESLPFEPMFSEIRKLQFNIILGQHLCYRRDYKRAQSTWLATVCLCHRVELWVMS